jgi:hypothetical protein
MSVEQSMESLDGETEVLGVNLPQFRFVHHKSHMTLNSGSHIEKPSTNRLSHGTTCDVVEVRHTKFYEAQSHGYLRGR